MAAPAPHPPGLAAPFEAVPLRAGSDVVVLCRGELDLAGGPRLSRLVRVLEGVPCDSVVLDLSDLAFIDAWGIGAIGRARDRLNDQGVEVVAQNPQRAVRRVLELCGLDAWLGARPTVSP